MPFADGELAGNEDRPTADPVAVPTGLMSQGAGEVGLAPAGESGDQARAVLAAPVVDAQLIDLGAFEAARMAVVDGRPPSTSSTPTSPAKAGPRSSTTTPPSPPPFLTVSSTTPRRSSSKAAATA